MTTATHGPEVRHIEVSRFHAGQMVTPVVHAWHKGTKQYVVTLAWHDASDGTTSASEEHVGDYWDCIHWLENQGCHAGW